MLYAPCWIQAPVGKQSFPALVMQLGQLQVFGANASSRVPEVDPPVPTTPPAASAPPVAVIPPKPSVPPVPATTAFMSVRPQQGTATKTEATRNEARRRIELPSYARIDRLPMSATCCWSQKGLRWDRVVSDHSSQSATRFR